MALNSKLATAAVNGEADGLAALLNGGKLRLCDGTQPATGDDEVGTQVLLAELTFGSPAFGAAANGVVTATAITKDSSANATGAASWCRDRMETDDGESRRGVDREERGERDHD